MLVDEVFPTLKGAALCELVTSAEDDALEDDLLEALFLPALERGTDQQRTSLLTKLQSFCLARSKNTARIEKRMARLEGSTVTEVRTRVLALKQTLMGKLAHATRVAALTEELRSDDVTRITKALLSVMTLTQEETDGLDRGLSAALRARGLSLETMTSVLRYCEKHDRHKELRAGFATAAITHGVDALREVLPSLAFREPVAAAKFLRAVARDITKESSDSEDVLAPITAMHLGAWARSLDGTTAQKEKSNELRDLLAHLDYDDEKLRQAITLLSQLETWEPDPFVPDEDQEADEEAIDWSEVASAIAEQTGDREEGWPALKLLARHLPKLELSGKSLERVLAQLLGVCSQGNDPEGLALLLAMSPQVPTWDILAFNLSGVRALAGERTQALAMARRALELGKPPSQFRSDSDFKVLLKDPEFVALLAEFSDP